ncbi:MAG: electron transfer flavoprotein subunit beta/FixA family protein [Clostridia bacterium]|nr:electron transfer flavoprotein subunit beta/FixA family protein [Clostridia bacterium]
MNVLVCVKQVPGSSNVAVDPVTGVLKRNGADTKINPYDLYAIETALSLVETYGGKVESLTMGPPAARAVIEETVCMGAAGGTVLSDRKFAGADVLATAYTLSEGIGRLGDYDIIFCGKQTTDGDTAQVGAELAEYLGIPNLSGVLSVDGVTDTHVTVTVALDDKHMQVKVALPCLLSMEGDVNTPRLPSYRAKKAMKEDAVRFLSFADFADQDEGHYGLNGSATQVERIFPPEKRGDKITLTGAPEEQAKALLALLGEKKMI